jgi:hypothetical protein
MKTIGQASCFFLLGGLPGILWGIVLGILLALALFLVYALILFNWYEV